MGRGIAILDQEMAGFARHNPRPRVSYSKSSGMFRRMTVTPASAASTGSNGRANSDAKTNLSAVVRGFCATPGSNQRRPDANQCAAWQAAGQASLWEKPVGQNYKARSQPASPAATMVPITASWHRKRSLLHFGYPG